MTGYSSGPVPGPPDVVIHFAGKILEGHSVKHIELIDFVSLCTKHAGPRLGVLPSQRPIDLQRC
jgi:hypothetical protein